MKFPNVSAYDFDKLHAFILDPVNFGDSCSDDDNFIRKQPAKPLKNNDYSVNAYFPDIWFKEFYQATSDDPKVYYILTPNTAGNWRLFGISMHPTKGFTVAKSQPIISIKRDVSIRIQAPSSVKETEVFALEIMAYNSRGAGFSGQIYVELENANTVHESVKEKYDRKCRKFALENLQSLSFIAQFPAEDKVKIPSILLTAIKSGDIKIRVTVVEGTNKYENTKVVKIEKEVPTKEILGSYLIELRNNQIQEIAIPAQSKNIKGNLAFYSDLVGPLLDGFEKAL